MRKFLIGAAAAAAVVAPLTYGVTLSGAQAPDPTTTTTVIDCSPVETTLPPSTTSSTSSTTSSTSSTTSTTFVPGQPLGLQAPPECDPGTGADLTDIKMEGCDVVVTFSPASTGTYELQIWDDQKEIASYPVTAQAGQATTLRHTVTKAVGSLADGLGIVITDGVDTELASEDPWTDPQLAPCAGSVRPAGATPVAGSPGYTG